MKLILTDFLDVVIARSGLKTEDSPLFKRWAKWIDKVDLDQPGGYAFVGDFIANGTIEIDLGNHQRLILAQSSIQDDALESGILRQFRILILHPNGDLKPTHIAADDHQKGWAYRIRDLVANLIQEIEKRPEFASTFSAIELSTSNETSRSVFDNCRICDRTLLGADRICPECSQLIEAVHAWAVFVNQHQKAANILTVLNKPNPV